jgi:Rod binding domain-containing protein
MMNINQSIPSENAAAERSGKLDPAQKLKLQKAVREFQSVFVGYLLKSMRSTVEKADNSTDSFGGDMLEGMFDLELSKHISKNSNLGMADMLYRKMTGESLSKAMSTVNPTGGFSLPTNAYGGSPPTEQKKVEGAENVESVRREEPIGVRAKSIDTPKVEPKQIEYTVPKGKRTAAVVQPNAIVTVRDEKKRTSLDDRLRSYDTYIAEASRKFGVSDSLIKAVIATESAARPNAQSEKNAKGLMQLIDSTASDMGVRNVWDPRQNILGGAKYLKQLLEKFDGDETLAVASYNAGPGNVMKHGGVPPFKETKAYVARVMNFLNVFAQQENDNE